MLMLKTGFRGAILAVVVGLWLASGTARTLASDSGATASSPASSGPSFACAGVLTPTEKAICSDEGLASLDRGLALAFQAKLAGLPADAHDVIDDEYDALVLAQKAWLVHRNDCGTDKACIRKAYLLRTGALTAPQNAPDVSCRDTAGAKQAAALVQQCLQVATETHPPCNAENSCELIISHSIFRCAFLGDGAPKFCATLPKR